MPSDYAFRFCTYLALALACVCLGVAEWEWLPEVSLLTVAVIATLVVSFRSHEALELSLGKANLLGLGIGVAAVLWLVLKLSQPATGMLANLTWPTNLLPFMGPVLMILIPAKLFRPKHVGDWWTMHGIGMATVALAASMNDDPEFAAILILYAVAEVASLVLLYYRQAGGTLPAMPGHVGAKGLTIATSDEFPFRGWKRLFGASALWLLVCLGLAFPLFFLTPRSGSEQWGFNRGRLETGFSADHTTDLNRTGELEQNAEVAFDVLATDLNGEPKDDLPGDQLWRGATCQYYENGRWKPLPVGLRSAYFPRSIPLETLGPESFFLDFTPMPSLKGRPVASPIFWRSQYSSPILTYTPEETRWPPHSDGGFTAVPEPRFVRPVRYRQITKPPEVPGLGEPFERSVVARMDGDRMEAQPTSDSSLRGSRNPAIRDWARRILDQMVAAGRLPRVILETANRHAVFQIAPEHSEQVARAFCEYFQTSPEFQYTLKLRRQDRKIDPVEDFLLNTKAGHCERFASALTLVLRSLEIPTQFVLGFKGFELLGNGQYRVRQQNAHAWVEVLIPRKPPPDFPAFDPQRPPTLVWHWLSLDPTPGDNQAYATAHKNWFVAARELSSAFFEDFIIGYNPERRQRAVMSLWTWFQDNALYLALVPTVGFAVFRFRGRKREQLVSPEVIEDTSPPDWYRQYLQILDRFGFPLLDGQTPREHAERTGTTLRAISHPEIAELPLFVVSKFYRVRFARHPLSEVETNDLHTVLNRLESALKSLPRPSSS